MRKKCIQSAIVIVFMGILVMNVKEPVTEDKSQTEMFSEWGSILSQNIDSNNEEAAAVEFYRMQEIAQARAERAEKAALSSYFKQQGMSEEEAKEQAIAYLKERDQLYEEAVKAGYDVTDSEVEAYLEELKQTLYHADNSEDVMAVMEQFDSEEDYWKYEFEVYKKDLPIIKYREAQNHIIEKE